MTNRVRQCLVLLLLIINLSPAAPAKIHSRARDSKTAPARAAEFTLKDQFGNELSYKFPRQKISVLAIADKDGSEQLEGWIRPLAEKYAVKNNDKFEIQGVAELSSVPGIAKGVVRNIIKKKSERPIMLDWTGNVAKSYNYEKDQANIFLINQQGDIIARENGAADAQKLEKLFRKIDALLR